MRNKTDIRVINLIKVNLAKAMSDRFPTGTGKITSDRENKILYVQSTVSGVIAYSSFDITNVILINDFITKVLDELERQFRAIRENGAEKEKVMKTNTNMNMGIKSITYNKAKGATTVVFKDDVVVVVRLAEGQEFDKYTAFTAAIAKRVYGSGRTVKRLVEWGEDIKPKEKKKAQVDKKLYKYRALEDLTEDEYNQVLEILKQK